MAEQDKEYLSVITSTKIEDVPGWIESYQKRVPKDQERKYTPEKFWTEWKDEKLNNNNTNLEVVWNTYDDIEKVKYKDAYDAKALPFIKPQTTVIFKGDGFERRSFPDYPNMDSVFENMVPLVALTCDITFIIHHTHSFIFLKSSFHRKSYSPVIGFLCCVLSAL
jgi:hypothetical protein